MIKKILSVIFNRWVLLALGLLLLFLVIWIVGPLVAVGEWRPLESPGARWLTMLLILLLVGLRMAWQAWRAKRSNEKVVNQLLEAAPAAPGSTEAAEVKVLRERFEAALQTLRNARFASAKGNWWDTASSRLGQRYLYELPWYIIIGAPGSGKTTALLNSGLRFPLADAGAGTDGARGVSGVGGTRNCDWWFTDQAVMIDTAGRYTTQDSDSEADSQAWGGFLGLLKKSRPRQPVNGVLVTVSVTDLLTRSARERLVHANAVRKRVQELHQQLGVRFPIYLLVTKCDLLSGFMDYLGDIDKEQRSTPFGFTFKLDGQHHSDTSVMLQEFDALEKRLTDGLIDRLQLERDVARRARIYGFPQQFGGLRQVLKEYVDSVFSPSQFEAHPMLRGVYFISGTQEGTPIDRMLGVLARTYRIERAVLPPNMATGKSFFLEKLLRDVVFGESELGGTDLKWERRRNAMAIAGYAAVAVLAVVLLVVWGRSYFGNRQYVNEVATRADGVRQLVQATPNRASPDLLVLLPALRATRDLATGGMGASVPWSLGFGLYQGDRLDAAAERSYERMLVDAVLPRIALRVEEQLRNGGQDQELQYEALKAYVMLHDPERFDAQALRFYVMADWDANLPRQVTTQQRAELDMHLDALLEQGPAVSPLAQDGVLLRQVRAVLAGVPLPQRIYSRLRRLGVAEDIASFTIAKAAGPSAGLAFMRGSGEPLTSGVTGLYTYEGYHRGFQRDLEATATQLVMEEGWVLGITDSVRLESLRDPAALGRLLDDVRRLYLNDYATIWRRFIADIKLLPTDNLAKTVQMARILSAPDTPLRPLIQGLVRETSLSATDPKSVVERAEDRARGALERSQRQLSRILGNRPQSQVVDGKPIESIVDDQFAGLRQMLKGSDGRPAPIDGTIGLLAEVYTMLVAVDAAVNSGSTPPPSPVNDKARAEAGRLPEPLRSLVDTLATAGLGGALKKTRENLGDQLNAEVGTFCRQALAGRYPLVRGSSTDATPQDFAEIFAPGARMDTFFQRNLAAFVDTSTRPWSFRNLGGASMGDPGTLTQFQRAAEIRDTFFRGSGRAPSLQLQFKPIEMDATITQFTLDVDGQVVRYSHGPQLATTVQWPGQRGASSVRISLLPRVAGGADLTKDGPWSLFRLFDQAQMRPGGSPERFQVTFDVGGRKATFEITTSSVQNPFALPQLASFSCPGRL
jgi:type VI secretion system protein ImpL